MNKLSITKREKEIIYLIAHEYTTKEIALKLFLSPETVKSHRKKLFTKFNVKNIAGLVRVGIQSQLIRVM